MSGKIVQTNSDGTSLVIEQNEIYERTEYIGNLKDAPSFLHDNEHIITGYRIGFNTTRKIFRSLFMIHNESVNIWSHIIGVILFILLIGYTFVYLAPPRLNGTLSNNLS